MHLYVLFLLFCGVFLSTARCVLVSSDLKYQQYRHVTLRVHVLFETLFCVLAATLSLGMLNFVYGVHIPCLAVPFVLVSSSCVSGVLSLSWFSDCVACTGHTALLTIECELSSSGESLCDSYAMNHLEPIFTYLIICCWTSCSG